MEAIMALLPLVHLMRGVVRSVKGWGGELPNW